MNSIHEGRPLADGRDIVGALLRLPGVTWGFNWPDGFALHHPDEYSYVQNAESIVTPFGTQFGVACPRPER